MNIDDIDLWLSIKDAAWLFGVPTNTLRAAIHNKELAARTLSAGGYGALPRILVQLSVTKAWHATRAATAVKRRVHQREHTARVIALHDQGHSAESIAKEMRMRIGAVMRTLQRERRRRNSCGLVVANPKNFDGQIGPDVAGAGTPSPCQGAQVNLQSLNRLLNAVRTATKQSGPSTSR